MKRSTRDRILTTHVGSLPRADGTDRAGGEDEAALRQSVAEVVARQRETGIDIVNEGEYTKGGDWLAYVDDRFDGFEARPPADGKPIILQGKDREAFADFYRHATERGTLFYEPAGQIKQARPHWVAVAPIGYRGQAALLREIEIFRAVVAPETEALSPRPRRRASSLTAATSITRARRSSSLRSARRCARNTRRSSPSGSSCRSTMPGCPRCGIASALRWGSRHSAATAKCASRRSTMRCAACPRSAFAIISAGAAGTARMPSTSSSRSSST